MVGAFLLAVAIGQLTRRVRAGEGARDGADHAADRAGVSSNSFVGRNRISLDQADRHPSVERGPGPSQSCRWPSVPGPVRAGCLCGISLKGLLMDRRQALATIGVGLFGGCLELESASDATTTDTATESATTTGGQTTQASTTSDRTTSDATTEESTTEPVEAQRALTRAWERSYASAIEGWNHGERVYVGLRPANYDGEISAVDLESGELDWTTEIEGFPGTIYLESGAGTLYASSRHWEEVYALDDATGERTASKGFGSTNGSGAFVDDTFVIGTDSLSGESTLYSLDAKTLTERWQRSGELRGFGGAVAVDGLAVADFRNGRLTAYDPQAGAVRWETEFNMGRVEYGPFLDDAGRLFAIDGSTREIVRVDPASGKQVWRTGFETRTGGIPPAAQPAFDGDRLYIGVERNVMALDIDSGEREWAHRLEPEVTSSVSLASDVCWVVGQPGDDQEPLLYGFDVEEGTQYYADQPPGTSNLKDVYQAGERLVAVAGSEVVGFDIDRL